MRHRHGLRKLNRTSEHRLAMLRNMCNSLLHARGDQDHAAQGQGTAPRRRAADHARQGADAGQPAPGLRPPARPRHRHQAVRRAGPALQGAPGRLHAHPEDGLPRRRQRADGVRRAGRPARAGRGREPTTAEKRRSQCAPRRQRRAGPAGVDPASCAGMPEPLLRISQPDEEVRRRTVVDDLSLEIAPGECLGVIGPNGAGKTTTIRMLPGPHRRPTAARSRPSACRCPQRVREAKKRDRRRARQFDSLDPDFSCAENLRVYGRYFGLPRAHDRRARAEAARVRRAAVARPTPGRASCRAA